MSTMKISDSNKNTNSYHTSLMDIQIIASTCSFRFNSLNIVAIETFTNRGDINPNI